MPQTWRSWVTVTLGAIVVCSMTAAAVMLPHTNTKPETTQAPRMQNANTEISSTTPANTKTTPTPKLATGEKRFPAYLTGYTYWDNTPPGSAIIDDPVVHQTAGGTGTYDDPITIAVGHSIASGVDTLDYPAGTRFYIPNLRKYFIVEDSCGDGPTPQNGPCHSGYEGHPWLDIWIDGAQGTKIEANDCANNLTGVHLVIENPSRSYAVAPGSVYENTCSQQYGDTPVTT